MQKKELESAITWGIVKACCILAIIYIAFEPYKIYLTFQLSQLLMSIAKNPLLFLQTTLLEFFASPIWGPLISISATLIMSINFIKNFKESFNDNNYFHKIFRNRVLDNNKNVSTTKGILILLAFLCYSLELMLIWFIKTSDRPYALGDLIAQLIIGTVFFLSIFFIFKKSK